MEKAISVFRDRLSSFGVRRLDAALVRLPLRRQAGTRCLLLNLRFETHVTVIDIDRKRNPVRSALLFQRVGPLHHQTVKL
jgi:hypothetical protein